MNIRSLGYFICLTALISLASIQNLQAQSWLEKGKQALGQVTSQPQDEELSSDTVGQGLKEALKVGTANVVDELGQPGGFFNNPELHIPLPASLDRVQSVLNKVGASSMLDDLELKLNQAAERATPKAKDLFWQAISEMTIQDVSSIYNGPDDAATRYFEDKMSVPLASEMKPTVQETLSQVGAVQSYNQIMDRYNAMPLVPEVNADLTTYTLDKTLEGIFTLLAQEEAAIRNEPAKRTTDLLKTVFGR
ncbi:MAG: DUF4197 domain-containing protein [Desulfovermiculus sp.]|nr:DUF4197 domain-containing protein [Desulfovermiculus sp.]